MIASPNSDVLRRVAPSICRSRSYVTRFWWIVSPMARSTASAASPQPNQRRSITPDKISEPGFTLSWPAYFGAVPWVASKRAKPSPSLEPGAMPRPPTWAASASER